MAKKTAKKTTAKKAAPAKTAKAPEMSEEILAEMKKAMKKPISAKDLAKKFDCSISAVYYRLRQVSKFVKSEIAPKVEGKRGPRTVLYSL